MSAAKLINRTRIVTGVVRASFVQITEPKSVKGSDPKYSVSLIIGKDDKETLDVVEKAIDNAIEDGASKFGGKVPKKSTLKLPLRDGDTDRDDEVYAGSFFINCNDKHQPQVVDANRNQADPSIIYSGCYIRASVSFYAFNTNGNKGIAAGLGNIQFIKDGESLGGNHISAADDFGAAEDAGDDDFLS